MNPHIITNEIIRAALRTVRDRATNTDIISANLVSAISIRGNDVGFILTINPAHKALYAGIEQQCERALLALEGVNAVRIIMTAHNSEPLPPTAIHPAPRERATYNLTPLEGVARIIAVASGKGGVGKSTTTVMLAHALVALGHRVGICDADIYGPSVPRMLGLAFKQPQVQNGKMLPTIAHGIMANSMGLITGDNAAILRGPMVSKSLNQLLRGTYWAIQIASAHQEKSHVKNDQMLEVPARNRGSVNTLHERDEHSHDNADEGFSQGGTILLIDLPPGTGDVQLSMAQQLPIDGAIIVTTPQAVSTMDADKAAQMFVKIDIPILGIIENMSYFIAPDGSSHALFGAGGGAKLAEKIGTRLLAELPLDPAIGAALDNGQNPFITQPQSACVKAFAALAAII